VIVHVGTSNGVQQIIFDMYGNLIAVNDRTPTGTFQAGVNVGWTFDAIFDTTSKVVQLVAHSIPDNTSLASSIQTVPYIGQIDGSNPLIQFGNPGTLSAGGVWTQPNVSGGVVCVQPFVFAFDNAGLVEWSAPALPLYLGVVGGPSGAGQARISAQKIVAGIALRGGGAQSPAALFWSLSEVITATFVGTTAGEFAFNTVSPSSSILSNASVIEYDGLYFWAGIDRFLVFNGTVNEVRNDFNQDFFYDNLTPGYETLTFAFKVPRYGEIWWCAAMFGSTVPNWAIIYNLRMNCWYDTPLPDGGRGAGYHAQGFNYPIMADTVNDGNGFGLWMHEYGMDKLIGTARTAIRSYFETGWMGGPINPQPQDSGLSFQQLEADLLQTGDMTAYIIGQANPRAPQNSGTPKPLLQTPGVPQEQMVSFKETFSLRYMKLHIESNVIGGNYVWGRSMGRGDASGDSRVVS
jgi:hypothetical protein